MIWLEPMLAAVGVFIADQVSKALVMSHIAAHETAPDRPFLSIQLSDAVCASSMSALRQNRTFAGIAGMAIHL